LNRSFAPDLIKVTEIFLVPSSFLVAALGTADTNLHRGAVSLLGLIISFLWWVCSREALEDDLAAEAEAKNRKHPKRTRILCWLPVVFVAGWAFSLCIHVWLWNRPLGVNVGILHCALTPLKLTT
jgi:hypothetical protein